MNYECVSAALQSAIPRMRKHGMSLIRMSLLFLISLTTALVAAYFYLNTFEKFSRILAFLIEAVSLVFL